MRKPITEQDKKARCRLCGHKKTEHEDPYPGDNGRCNSQTFRYDFHQLFNTRCVNCGEFGGDHRFGGCDDFVPEPWDERVCLHCNHLAVSHREKICLGGWGDCNCKSFASKPGSAPPVHRVVPPRTAPLPAPTQGRYVAPAAAPSHANCAYVGTCLANRVDPSVKRCMK